ncbi:MULTISPECIES: amino acid ABC transporter permease [Desulfosporosinus]|uniref:Amino acid ABC transporter membrane protein 1, PAAT family n=1 Tax=Desulfosporosinus meridiei (strain ATCC BAA-275 / DSM 13257 / KCTC 12902 / NCIMB 13706 / S10) TaxID=768704 RepID=J7IR47_DESMD|nr:MULTISPECIES: amino acid ABC transporter permease [Desulfosporosinus]AFQ42659.1 amino acid ABC transporter membrane protein 1, PAAT family [Desulfosporosinus meridiei DSM 13257]KGK91899.1 polar amino acid ABC transporter permease [Desulfosporosinus sp. HMP52]
MVGPFAWFKWEALFRDWTVLAEGFKTTIMVAILSLALALILGIVFGVLGTSQWTLAKLVSRVYVEFIQNTPLVIQVFFLYHGLPHMGVMLPVFTVGVLGVGVYHGAYIAEVVRAGINSIHKGQMEAALSQGFSFWGAMRHVILPQASRVVLPPLTNQAVNLIKNTSVMAMVAGGDLMYRADSWSSDNLYYGPAYVAVGLLYLLLCLPLATLTRRFEGKTGVSA